MLRKIIFKKKIIIPFFIILILGGYFIYKNFIKKENEIQYVTATIEKGTLVVSVSGSGQIALLDQVDIKPRVSGDITVLYINKDQEVKTGQVLVELDSKTAEQEVGDAESNLEIALSGLEKLKTSKEDAETDLAESYDNSFDSIADVFIDSPELMNKLKTIFSESSYGGDQADIDYYRGILAFFAGQARSQKEYGDYYLELEKKYENFWKLYQLITKTSSPQEVENLLQETFNFSEETFNLSTAVRDIIISYQKIIQEQSLTSPIPDSITASQLSDITDISESFDQKVSNLSSAIKTIKGCKETIENYDDDIQSQEVTVKQREDALSDAKEKLADYSIQAPFDGIIVEVSVRNGDTVSVATTLATLITKQKIAEITLNEVDVAKVKVGQKSTLTFDALPDLSIAGKVIEVDTIGTASQGVVSYDVKIALDLENEQIKPGMSVTADVITDAKQGVILAPNSAVKSQQNVYYVQVMENDVPSYQQVEIGLSNDTMTEIVSGLEEGDVVITSTANSSTNQTNTRTQNNQGFEGPPGSNVQMFFR